MTGSRQVGRNDPCPCGSGSKYKRCCLGTDEDPEVAPKSTRAALVVAVLGLVLAGAAVPVAGAEAGGIGAVVALMVAGAVYVFNNMPPPNSDSGSPGGINFGT